MRPLRFHPDPSTPTGSGARSNPGDAPAPTPPADPTDPGNSNRLNLLLSCASWQDETWADRLPRLLEPMGVRAHRAQSAREATRVIETIPIHVAIVDLGLPLDGTCSRAEEAGPRLLDLLARTTMRPPTVVIKRRRTVRDEQREMTAALRAGAFAVLDRPMDTRGMESVLDVLRRVLTRHYRDRWPGAGGLSAS